MEKVKYCPKCQNKCALNAEKCTCGYEFVKVETGEDTTVQNTNTRVIVDKKPLGLWTFIGFISCSVAGFILWRKFKEEYPARSQAALRGAISFLITLGVILAIVAIYLILNANGKIV